MKKAFAIVAILFQLNPIFAVADGGPSSPEVFWSVVLLTGAAIVAIIASSIAWVVFSFLYLTVKLDPPRLLKTYIALSLFVVLLAATYTYFKQSFIMGAATLLIFWVSVVSTGILDKKT